MSYIVVTAEPAKLRKVRRRLRRKGYTAYLPAIARRKAYMKDVGGKQVIVKRKLIVSPLMSYIFVEVPDAHVMDLWLYDVKATRDARDYLKSGDSPALVPGDKIAELKTFIERSLSHAEAMEIRKRLFKGDSAKAKNGAFANHAGVVLEIRKQVVKWETYLFGRPTTVLMKADDLEKLEEKAA